MRRPLAVTLAVLMVFAAMVVPLAAQAQGRSGGGHTVPVTGTLNGVAATGTFTIRQVVQSPPGAGASATGIAAVGTLVLRTAAATTTFDHVTVPVNGIGTTQPVTIAQAQPGTCPILDLTLGPVDLNLLGLVVHLDVVHLEIVAVPGPGNLLGNLLCAIAGLLDPQPNLPLLGGLLQQVINVLNQILNALG